ncbi:pilus assembly protein PilP [Pseudomonas sp. BCRC 81390]|uniref:pilus assembly protein PilP n=1 Tax=Pseudomonas sp. BCRC 81390 TaxID=3054778 RepID=UPI002592885B|nr:pilus assembly protein PilP [Pseudomonas sp. BCRC 81390]MDM3887420.1 pilus assembly protein PilP [Pseudomonas sp. BCRC 81390]
MNAAKLLAWLTAVGSTNRFRQLAPILLAVALFGLGCMIRLPAPLQQQAHEAARHAELTGQQAANAARVGELEQLQASVALAEQRLGEAQWQLAAGEGMSDLLDRLAAMGQAHGLLIEQVVVQEGEQQAGFRRVPLELQLVGRYTALRQWLGDWLGQARVLRGDYLRLAAADGLPGLLRLQLRVDTYQALAPTPAPAVLARMPARAATPVPAIDPFAPGASRLPSDGLASVPLAQLEMVGSLSRGAMHEALLRVAGRLYRVRLGDRVGRDQGVVTQIDPRQVEVRERLFMAGGWRERTAFLTLAKRLGKEAPDQNETSDEVGAGSPAVDPAGIGHAVPG